MCLCSPSSINWYRLRLGVKCTTAAVLGMLAAIRRTLRLAANRRHSSIVLTCCCHCTEALKWLLSLTSLYKLSLLYLYMLLLIFSALTVLVRHQETNPTWSQATGQPSCAWKMANNRIEIYAYHCHIVVNVWTVCVKVTSEACSVDEELKYGKSRRRRSAALSTPPAVHVHIGSDGPASNGSISSRGNTVWNQSQKLFCG